MREREAQIDALDSQPLESSILQDSHDASGSRGRPRSTPSRWLPGGVRFARVFSSSSSLRPSLEGTFPEVPRASHRDDSQVPLEQISEDGSTDDGQAQRAAYAKWVQNGFASEGAWSRDSCQVCAVERKAGSSVYTLRVLEMVNSASGGCRACAGIGRFLGQNKLLPLDGDPLNLQGIKMSRTRNAVSSDWPIYEYFTYEDYSTETPLSMSQLGSAALKCGRDPSGFTLSIQAFATLRSWIADCQENHALCAGSLEKPLPSRVLKIESIQPLKVRLVENDPCRERYACLSHRWGPDTAIHSLKAENLAIYQRGIPSRHMYPLITDAVSAAWELGIKYLWIDSYCILQDDIRDWHREAACMADIYENAFITLSASAAIDGGPISSKSSQNFKGHQITEIGGTPIFMRQCLHHPSDTQDLSEWLVQPRPGEASTLARGWIFQERILSRRFVHFLQDELYWECRERTWCECRSQEDVWKWRRAVYPRVLERLDWCDLVRDYSRTALTYEKDRLPALSGVARRFGDVHHKTYLAGMWLEDLPSTFLWYTDAKCQKARRLSRGSPSWSWMSISDRGGLPAGVHLANVRCNLIQFLGYSREPETVDVYTDPHMITLTVSCPVVEGTVYPDRPFVKALGVLWLVLPDFDMEPDDPVNFKAVKPGSDVLIMLCRSWAQQWIIVQRVHRQVDGQGEAQETLFERVGILGSQISVNQRGVYTPKSVRPSYVMDYEDLLPYFDSTAEADRQSLPFSSTEVLKQAERRTLRLV